MIHTGREELGHPSLRVPGTMLRFGAGKLNIPIPNGL